MAQLEPVLDYILRFIQDTNFVISLYELVICSLLLRKRSLFPLRALLYVPYIILTNNVIGIVDYFNKYLIVGEMHFGYMLYFLVSVFIAWFCFKEKFSHMLYFCTAAYVIENLGYQIGNILYLAFCQGSPNLGDYHDPRPFLYSVYRELLEIPILITVALVFVRNYKKHYDFRIKNSHIIAIESLTLVVIVFLNYYATMDGDMNFMARIYAAIVDVMILLFQFVFFNETRLRYENDVTSSLLKIQSRQSRLSKESVETINVKCHDLKRQISALRLVGDEKERERAIRELEQAVNIYEARVHTGNDTLDIVLMEKLLLCNANKINLVLFADGSLLSFMHSSDLYVLFSNALDNAMESVEKVEEENRNILLVVEKRESFVRICVENYCAKTLEFVNGVPLTTKNDRSYHGYGTKSILRISEEYDGTVVMKQEGNRFILRILLPIKECDENAEDI